MIDGVHLALQFLSHGVQRAVVVDLGGQVVTSRQVLESVQVVPVTGSAATGVMVHHLDGWTARGKNMETLN